MKLAGIVVVIGHGPNSARLPRRRERVWCAMLDRADAKTCLDALSSAIAALGEACVDAGALTSADYQQSAQDLERFGDDIAALARAMAVIARRVEI